MAVVDRRLVSSLIALQLGLWACSSAESSPTEPDPDPPEGCAVGERLAPDGSCLPAGVQDDGCPAGQLGLADGSCQPAGVAADACAGGFAPDEAMGCAPVLPAEPCPAGQLAVPGDTVCGVLAGCGVGPWGDIPVEASTTYVDGAYAGGGSDGSADRPWLTIAQGIAAAEPNAIVAIAAGSYEQEQVLEGKPVRLWGVCPALVEIVGYSSMGAVRIRQGAGGTEVRSLSLRSFGNGLSVSGAEEVLVEAVRFHETYTGAAIDGSHGPTSVTLRQCLFENNEGIDVLVRGGEVTIEQSLVRGRAPGEPGPLSTGINSTFDEHTQQRSRVVVRRSVIEGTFNQGVLVQGADAVVEASVIRDIELDPAVSIGGYGVLATEDLGQRASVLVDGSRLERTPDGGIVAVGSDVTVTDSVLRDLGGLSADGGPGLYAQDGTLGPSIVTLQRSLIEGAHGFGVALYGAEGLVEGTIIRHTQPFLHNGEIGLGLGITDDRATVQRSRGVVRGSLLHHNHSVGILVEGSEATLEGLLIQDTLAQPSNQLFGRGLQVQDNGHTGNVGSASLRGSAIERSLEFGVAVVSANVAVDGCAIHQTAARATDQLFGDAVVVVSTAPERLAALALFHGLLADSERAGLALFGGAADLTGTRLDCNAIHLDGEDQLGLSYSLQNLGGNLCACGDEHVDCRVVTAGLEPPEPM